MVEAKRKERATEREQVEEEEQDKNVLFRGRRGDASAEHRRPEVTSDFAEVRTSRRSAGLVHWEIRRQRGAAECEDDRKRK